MSETNVGAISNRTRHMSDRYTQPGVAVALDHINSLVGCTSFSVVSSLPQYL